MIAQYAAERNDAHADTAVCRKDGVFVLSIRAEPNLRAMSSLWSIEARAFVCCARTTTVSPSRLPWSERLSGQQKTVQSVLSALPGPPGHEVLDLMYSPVRAAALAIMAIARPG